MEQEYNHPLYMLNYMLNKATRGGVSKAGAAASGRAARRRRPLNLAAGAPPHPRALPQPRALHASHMCSAHPVGSAIGTTPLFVVAFLSTARCRWSRHGQRGGPVAVQRPS